MKTSLLWILSLFGVLAQWGLWLALQRPSGVVLSFACLSTTYLMLFFFNKSEDRLKNAKASAFHSCGYACAAFSHVFIAPRLPKEIAWMIIILILIPMGIFLVKRMRRFLGQLS